MPSPWRTCDADSRARPPDGSALPHPLPAGAGLLSFPCLSPVFPSPLEGEGGPELVEGPGEGAFPLLPVRNDKVLEALLPLHRHRLARSREISQIRLALQPPRKLLP